MARTIVITGAGGGLGRALARRFAGEGETVVLLGRTVAKVEAVAAELGGDALAVACDVTDPDSVRAAFATIGERFGHVDVVINNAAIFKPFLVKNATDDQIRETIGTNISGTMFCTREAIPLMRGGGHIINVSSESVRKPFPFLIAYQTSKAAIEQFSDSLEREVAADGIRVSCVRAGQMMDQDATGLAASPEEAKAFFEAALANGIDLRKQPISQYASVTDAFVALVNLPADVHMGLVTLTARRAG